MRASTIARRTVESRGGSATDFGAIVVRARTDQGESGSPKTDGCADAVGQELPDLLQELLDAKPSAHTRRAYRKDIEDFFEYRYGLTVSQELAAEFARLPLARTAFALEVFRRHLEERGMAPATVNRKIAAVQSLLATAARLGTRSEASRAPIRLRRPEPNRRTEGLTSEDVVRLLEAPDTTSLKGKRDRALLLLMVENALRSGELRALQVADLNIAERRLLVTGRSGSARSVLLSRRTTEALEEYMAAYDQSPSAQSPLFRSLHPGGKSEPLTSDGLYKVLAELASKAGVKSFVNPRVLRHTSIAAAVDATNGNRAVVRQFSGLARTGGVARYDQAVAIVRDSAATEVEQLKRAA